MGGDPIGRPPAWYRDPDRSDRLRYWDGDAWTNRRRPVPRWAPDDQDTITLGGPRTGPSYAAELPAPTAEVTTSREAGPAAPGSGPGSAAGSSNAASTAPIRRPADDGPPGPHDPGSGGGGGGDGSGDGDSGGHRNRRRVGLFAFVVIVLTGLAVAISAIALAPKSYGPRVLTRSGFLTAANRLCDKSLSPLRPPVSADPFGATVTPGQAADQIDHAATGLDQLASQLRALPSSPADRPHIDEWLDGWGRYAGLGRQYAAILRQNGTPTRAPQAELDARKEAATADRFALANGLSSCTFLVTPHSDPSSGVF
jgi:Protein of unknown function (DUF2510)